MYPPPHMTYMYLPYVAQIAEHLFLLPDQLEREREREAADESSPAMLAAEDSGNAGSSAFMEEWLSTITGRMVTLYFNAILAIPSLSSTGQTQLAADMQYLTSILDRLGAPGLHNLEQLQLLIEASVADFPQLVTKKKKPKP